MNLNAVSIFDLSPPEKLQLVEDLWDDLAATPSDIPVHEWQREELARRKANLLSNPASALSWDEIKRRVRSRFIAESVKESLDRKKARQLAEEYQAAAVEIQEIGLGLDGVSGDGLDQTGGSVPGQFRPHPGG